MADWSPWNWIGYGSLAISAFGLAIGNIIQRYPQLLSRLPSAFSSPLWSFAPAVFLIVATVIFLWQLFFPSLVAKSELTLRTYTDQRWPERLYGKNDWRYFYMRNVVTLINKETGEKSEHMFVTLFVTFNRPTKVGTLSVDSPDMKLPRHETKEFK